MVSSLPHCTTLTGNAPSGFQSLDLLPTVAINWTETALTFLEQARSLYPQFVLSSAQPLPCWILVRSMDQFKSQVRPLVSKFPCHAKSYKSMDHQTVLTKIYGNHGKTMKNWKAASVVNPSAKDWTTKSVSMSKLKHIYGDMASRRKSTPKSGPFSLILFTHTWQERGHSKSKLLKHKDDQRFGGRSGLLRCASPVSALNSHDE